MRLLSEPRLDFDDVLILPKRSQAGSREEVQLERTFKMKHSRQEITCIPILPSNMFATGSIKMSEVFNSNYMPGCLHKYYTNQEITNHLVLEKKMPMRGRISFSTFGESDGEFARLNDFLSGYSHEMNSRWHLPSFICIDVANGYRARFVDYIKRVRELVKNGVLMVGNVCTAEMTNELIMAGADIIKIGIGPGSVCETRSVTGVGNPQLSAIIECADAAHGLQAFICADGGMKTSGDICKAFCAGADFVMLGGMLAGTDECNGQWNTEYISGFDAWQPELSTKPRTIKKSLKFFGMSSYEAMQQFGGADKEYRASEGKCIEVPYKGPVADVIKEIHGGLRSCATYIGADRIKDFSKCATLIRKAS